ncbi:MAG TPA: hypothetical protein PLP21_04790 [Pyrinomonadaceae bacterium]|nr:hypothetical protein [Acidobacteriota bacterium]HQZ95611.1 hypothetical protein [Pyrinomonadaceae bacterium]
MNSVEAITTKVQMLPPASQKQVLDYVNSLLEKPVALTKEERIAALKEMVERHAGNRAVILDDSREAIYED